MAEGGRDEAAGVLLVSFEAIFGCDFEIWYLIQSL
jgi:hypothetical protein